MGDQKVIVKKDGEMWCQNSKEEFNVRLILNMREKSIKKRGTVGKGYNDLRSGMLFFIFIFKSFRFN